MTKVISAIACVLLIGGAIVSGNLAVGCIGAVVIMLSYGLSPRGYIISEESIVVRRLVGNVRIPLDSIREVRAADPGELRRSIRIFGNGGLFGYYGVFRTSGLGTCRWYLTNRANAVILATRTLTAVFSPDDVNGFINAIRAVAPENKTAGVVEDSVSKESRTLRWNLTGTVIGIVVLLLGLGFLFYSPGQPDYTLNSEGLVIRDRFYPVTLRAAEIDIENIRVVDIGTDPHWRPTARTNGFANAHYRSGWFRVAGGEKVRMYRADGRRLVLFPPIGKTAPVLMEVKQPESFIQEVKRAWQ